MSTTIKKRLVALKEVKQQQPTQRRGLDDFYADINDPSSEGYALLNSFYSEVEQ